MNPFSQQTAMQQQYENLTGGGSSLATLTFATAIPQTTVPCTHTQVAGEVVLVLGGFSPKTMVDQCEVRVSTLGGYIPKRGHLCSLMLNPTASPIRLKVRSNNILPGGEIYRLTLEDENWGA